jgi:hypothetical protein
MGSYTGARSAYTAVVDRASRDKTATDRAEKQVMKTKKLNPLVDPGSNKWGKSRRSLIRFNDMPDGRFEVAVGLSVPVEIMLDTTGSMGGNVDIALKGIPDTRDNLQSVMRNCCEAHVCTGVFNDVVDRFDGDGSPGIVLTRSQFEMTEKMAEQMQHHIPMRKGAGNGKEDSQFGLFAAAYLSSFYINRIGLKSYHFTMTDDAADDDIDVGELERIFGKDVAAAVAKNGHEVDVYNLTTKQVVKDLLTRTHAFCLLVNADTRVTKFWQKLMGEDRVIMLPDTKLVSQVMPAIVGLTEGTLELSSVVEYLKQRGVSSSDATMIERSVRNIPIGAQTTLENFNKIPGPGDIFETKDDLWPVVYAKDRKDFDKFIVGHADNETGAWL